jgi:hypothetical protein
MGDFPKLVKRMTDTQARTLGCESCGYERQATDEQVACYEVTSECPNARCDGARLDWAYFEGDPCPSCGTLGIHDKEMLRCCSRRCMLQVEYARTLGRAA